MNPQIITTFFVAGMISLFSAERYFDATGTATALRVAGTILMAGALAAHIWRWRSFTRTGKFRAAACETWMAGWKVAVLFATIVWFAWNHVTADASGPTATSRILLGLWTVPLMTAIIAGAGIEWTVSQSQSHVRGEPDPARIGRAGQAWIATGLLLCALVAINYSVVRRDISRDWSYLKTTEPGEATVNIARNSKQPVTIAIFYPRDNEVLPWVEQYATKLTQAAADKVTLRVIDKDADPLAASHFKTSRNGVVVLESGARQERMDLGPTLTAARPLLKKLDSEFQRLLMILTSKPKNAYVMRGHGELSPNSGEKSSPLESSKLLEGFLRDQNWNIKTFGVAEGSASRVPDDATAVIVLGPRNPVIKEEVAALREFTARGGALLLALDPGKPQEQLEAWLESTGVRYEGRPVANERNHVSATRSPVDTWFLFTTSFANHDSIKTLSRNDDKVAVLAFEAGSFTTGIDAGSSSDWHVSETVRSLADSFVDLNRNYKFDEKTEKRGATPLGLAMTLNSTASATPNAGATSGITSGTTESRVVLFGDSAAFSDALIRNPGNLTFVADSMNWLAGEQAFSGKQGEDEDVRIRQTGKQDLVWFYGSILVVPLTVLFAGGLTIRAGKRRNRK